MFDANLWGEIAATIKKNRLRTVLTGISVAWGIFMLIVLLGAGNGLSNGMRENFAGDANNSIWIYQGTTSKEWKGLKAGRRIRYDNEDVEYIRRNLEHTELVSARFWLPFNNLSVSYKNEFSSYEVNAVDPEIEFIEECNVKQGRFINDIDNNNFRKVVVLGHDVKKKLFKDQDPIGEYVKINKAMFQVIGTYKDANNRDNKRVYIPRATAQKIFNGGNRVHSIAIRTGIATPLEVKKLENELLQYFSRKYSFDPADKKAIRISNRLDDYTRTLQVFTGITVFVLIIGIMTIISGVVGVSNIMMITVRDRTKEIGIRKALGATPANVVFMVILEAIIITSVAGYIGMVAGIGLMEGVNVVIEQSLAQIPEDSNQPTMFRNPTINVSIAAGATLLLVVAGTIAGFIPARKAARIRPVVALRDE